MSSEETKDHETREKLRSRVLATVAAGATCLAATAAIQAPALAEASPVPQGDPSAAQAEPGAPGAALNLLERSARAERDPVAQKQWWHNGWVRPWSNWNNWRNWPNWPNWHNFWRRW